MESGYTITEASKLLGMKRRTLAFYADSGFVVPEIEPAGGRGTTRWYSRRNLFQFMLVRDLNVQGVTLGNMARVMALFRFPNSIRESLFRDEDTEYIPYYLAIYNHTSENADISLLGPIPKQNGMAASGPGPGDRMNFLEVNRYVYNQQNQKREHFKSLMIVNVAEIWAEIRARLGE